MIEVIAKAIDIPPGHYCGRVIGAIVIRFVVREVRSGRLDEVEISVVYECMVGPLPGWLRRRRAPRYYRGPWPGDLVRLVITRSPRDRFQRRYESWFPRGVTPYYGEDYETLQSALPAR